jgi:hypothetical protein
MLKLSYFLENRFTDGGEHYMLATPLLPGKFLVLISVRGWVKPRAIVRPAGIGQLEIPMTLPGVEPMMLQIKT